MAAGSKLASLKRRISPDKAREMLRNPPHGKALTAKQKRLFHMMAKGK